MHNRVLIALGLFVAFPVADAQRSVSEAYPPAGPLAYFGSAPVASNPIVGETFDVLSTGPVLQDFSFWLSTGGRAGSAFTGIAFTPSVQEWDGIGAIGPTIWTGAQVFTTGNLDGFQQFNFATGGLVLSPGQLYVAVLTAVTGGGYYDWVGIDGTGAVPPSNPNLLAVASNTSNPGGGPWVEMGYSFSFQADFTAAPAQPPPPLTSVPEPGTFALLATGLVVLAGTSRRRLI